MKLSVQVWYNKHVTQSIGRTRVESRTLLENLSKEYFHSNPISQVCSPRQTQLNQLMGLLSLSTFLNMNASLPPHVSTSPKLEMLRTLISFVSLNIPTSLNHPNNPIP